MEWQEFDVFNGGIVPMIRAFGLLVSIAPWLTWRPWVAAVARLDR